MSWRRAALPPLAAAAHLAAGAGATASAQQLDLWLDASALHSLPPAGVIGADAATFGLLGSRLRLARPGTGSLELALYGGRSADPEGGLWLSGSLGAGVTGRIGAGAVSARIETFGLQYRRPFAYTAYGASLVPRLSTTLGELTLTARGDVTRGAWSRPATGPIRVTDGTLSVTGGAFSIGRPLGPVWLEATGNVYRAGAGAAAGTFRGIDLLLAFSVRDVTGTVEAGLWDAPTGSEVGYRASLTMPIAHRLDGRIGIGRSVTDPLYGSPGSFTANVGLSWRLASRSVSREPPVVEVVGSAGGGRRVRFQLPAGDAQRVALAGDFTGWEPRPMRRAGDVWLLELVLESGIHHFGFVLDGEQWYVPDHAPGIVDDGWGRRNGSIVVARQ